MSTIGQILSAAREAQLLTVDDVSQSMSVPAEWLKDLEADHFEAFGNEVHAQAAVRLYASHLGLDGDALLNTGQVVVSSSGNHFQPKVAGPATRAQMLQFLTSQAVRSSDTVRNLAVFIGLELLAGIGMLVVRLGG